MKKQLFALILLCASYFNSNAFCGFYVAKADTKLFNRTSQVILVRNGERTTITMSSDFKGNVNEFAMVIPVPTVLKKEEIKVTDRNIFEQLDAYSGPRLVEYYDPHPCESIREESTDMRVPTTFNMAAKMSNEDEKKDKYHVTISAKYTIGEYDILILSAEQSGGLERWLIDNGYKIPSGAKEVLEPYIKSNMKFFVVKVNLEEQRKSGIQTLRPLQLSFTSKKFMLPIRLGMANGEGEQDLVIYSFTQSGRTETTNYRTVKMPTDRNVPEFIKDYFGRFYVDLYKENLRKEGNDNVFLEYAWDLSSQTAVKCDPCPSPPPIFTQFQQAGVDWIQSSGWGYTGQVFFTRLHVTYDRQNFPQDLVFQETPNRELFQCRYILNHPAQKMDQCPEWKEYADNTKQRRKRELRELSALTGWDVARYWQYPSKFQGYAVPEPPDETTGYVSPQNKINPENENTASVKYNSRDTSGFINQTAFIDNIHKTSETSSGFGSGLGIIALILVAGAAALYQKFNS